MAPQKKKNSRTSAITNFLSIFSGNVDIDKIDSTVGKNRGVKPIGNLANKAGRDVILSDARQTRNVQSGYTTLEGLISYSSQVNSKITSNADENKRLIKIFPELNQAMQLVLACITSPSDLQQNRININIGDIDGLQRDVKVRIVELLTDYYEDELHLSTNLPKWIKNALYIYGSQPLLLLPTKTLSSMLNDYTSLSSVESQRLPSNVNNMVFSSETYQAILDKICDKKSDTCVISNELLSLNYNNNTVNKNTIEKDRLDKLYSSVQTEGFNAIDSFANNNNLKTVDSRESTLRSMVEDFTSSEYIVITENTDALGLNKVFNDAALERIRNNSYKSSTKNIDNLYSVSDAIMLKNPEKNDKILGNPISIALPPESVIPIFSPGLENEHLMYMILLDQDGVPVKSSLGGDSDTNNNLQYTTGSSGSSFSSLFKAYGQDSFNQSRPNSKTIDYTQIKTLYQNIIEGHLKNQCSSLGFNGISLGSNDSLFKNLFYRYLNQRRTRIVIVPNNMLSYLAFEYDDNGLGTSVLENNKFMLALKLNSLVCRTTSAILNSINKTKLNISVGENYHGDLGKLSSLAENLWVRKNSQWDYSTDPLQVSEQRNRKSVSIGMTGGPEGADITGFSFSDENVQRNIPPIDDALDEILDKHTQAGLIVPANAINQLGETDFAATVLTNNAFFTRVISIFQNTAVPTINKHLRNYTKNSSYLRQAILKLLHSDEETKENDQSSVRFGNTDNGSVDTSKVSKANETRNKNKLLMEIIESITIMLPKPEVVPSKSQLETINNLYSNINSYVDGLLPDEIAAGNETSQLVISTLRSFMKIEMVNSQSRQLGIPASCVPDIMNFDFTQVRDYIQLFQNATQSVVKQREAITGQEPDPSMSMGGGNSFGGGYDDGYGNSDNGDDMFDTGEDTTGDSELNDMSDSVTSDMEKEGSDPTTDGVKIT